MFVEFSGEVLNLDAMTGIRLYRRRVEEVDEEGLPVFDYEWGVSFSRGAGDGECITRWHFGSEANARRALECILFALAEVPAVSVLRLGFDSSGNVVSGFLGRGPCSGGGR